MTTWNQTNAIKAGKAWTRDGRPVSGLIEAMLGGQKVLIGYVVTLGTKKSEAKYKFEHHFWRDGGLGCHGGDDLINDRPTGAVNIDVPSEPCWRICEGGDQA